MKQLRRILLISGGRYNFSYPLITGSLAQWKPDLIIHGGAIGTDSIAAEWADKNGVATTKIPVPPEDYTLYGKRAPKMRNTTMVNHVLDAYCVLENGLWGAKFSYLVSGMFFPGREGTADCRQKWSETGMTGIEVYPEGWVEFGVI